MSKTFEEWVELYNRKAFNRFKHNENFVLFYFPEKGFAELACDDEMIIVLQMCGVLKFWRHFIDVVASGMGRKKAVAITCRKVEPFLRSAGFVIYETEKTEYGNKYLCVDKNTGQKGTATPINNRHTLLNWEVNFSGI